MSQAPSAPARETQSSVSSISFLMILNKSLRNVDLKNLAVDVVVDVDCVAA